MPFSFKGFFKDFTSSAGSSIANIGTFGLANTGEAIFKGGENLFDEILDNSENTEINKRNRALNKQSEEAQKTLAQQALDQQQAERLRTARQPGRRQTLLNLQGGSSLLTGF